MKDSKLVYYLGQLSKAELRKFRLFLESPLFNDRQTLVKLYDVLEREFLRGKGEMSREELYGELYGDTPFNASSLRSSMAQLFSLLRKFLPFLEFQSDQVLQQRLLLSKANELGDDKFFSGFHKKAVQELAKAQLNASDHYMELMLLEEELDRFRLRQGGRHQRGMMQEAAENLGYSFLVRMMRYQLRALNLQASFQEQTHSSFWALATSYVETHLAELPPVLRLYFHFFQAFSQPEEVALYTAAKENLKQHRDSIPQVDLEELYVNALNFCAQRLNEGDLEYLRRVFDLYREMLDLELIQRNGYISPHHCKNISSVAFRLREFEWAQDFLDTWQHKILHDYAGNAFQYNRGLLMYFQGRYEEAERHFNKILDGYRDIFYGLNSRGYLLQIYYETGNSLGLESLSHSFRMFLQRNSSLSLSRQKQYIAFINHLRRLVNLAPNDRERREKLREDILNKKPAGMGKAWLLAKIDEL